MVEPYVNIKCDIKRGGFRIFSSRGDDDGLIFSLFFSLFGLFEGSEPVKAFFFLQGRG